MEIKSLSRKLSPYQFRNLRDLIYEASGIFFPESKLYLLEGRLGVRLTELGMNDFPEYIRYLRDLSHQNDELKRIYNLITINETFFFRFRKQLDVFNRTLLPNFIKVAEERSQRSLKIWSAASSSGEELYTLAILIRELLGSRSEEWQLDLKGSDISKDMLDRAAKAEYGENSFRGQVDPYFVSKYFINEGHRYQLKESIREMASFNYLNLNDTDTIVRQRKYDFIFCRNVLIYFDKEMKKRVIKAFYETLNHGGYLLLGESESLHGVSSEFKVEHFPGAFVYKKE